MSYRPKIKKLTKIIGGISGMLHPINGESPAYYSLAVILSDDHTDMPIAAGLQKYRTIAELSKKYDGNLAATLPMVASLMCVIPRIGPLTATPRRCPSNRSWRKNSPMWKSPFCRW